MGGQQDAQRDRKRKHPLAHRYARDHAVDQVGSALRHAPRPAGGANPRRLQEKATSFSCAHCPCAAGREGKPRCARIWIMTMGSTVPTMIFKRPPVAQSRARIASAKLSVYLTGTCHGG